MNNRVRTLIIIVVTIVWAINFTAPVFVKDYAPSPELNVAFMAIIGILTASYKLEKDKNEDPPSRPSPPPAPEPPKVEPPTQKEPDTPEAKPDDN